MTSGSYRHFCFTAFTNVRPALMDWMKYLISGQETCPTTGRVHFQCHTYSKQKITLKSAIRRLRPFHVEVSKDPEASITYCKKDGDWQEAGERPSQGARSDLKEVTARVLNGDLTINQLLIDDPLTVHRYGRVLAMVEEQARKKVKREFMPECYWLYGPTGVGKSRAVHDEEKDLYVYPYEKNGWWDGYDGQTAVLFDDFRGQLPLNELLRICDRYPYNVPRRGQAPFPFMAKRIYFTSCKRPEEVYKEAGESITQLERRVEVKFIDGVLETFQRQN